MQTWKLLFLDLRPVVWIEKREVKVNGAYSFFQLSLIPNFQNLFSFHFTFKNRPTFFCSEKQLTIFISWVSLSQKQYKEMEIRGRKIFLPIIHVKNMSIPSFNSLNGIWNIRHIQFFTSHTVLYFMIFSVKLIESTDCHLEVDLYIIFNSSSWF